MEPIAFQSGSWDWSLHFVYKTVMYSKSKNTKAAQVVYKI